MNKKTCSRNALAAVSFVGCAFGVAMLMGLLAVPSLAATPSAVGPAAPSKASSLAPVPEYWPTCQSPQPIAPMQAIGGMANARTAVAWNGKDYAVVWVDSSSLWLCFRRFFADGTPAGPAVVSSTRHSRFDPSPCLVWNGSGYAVAWVGASPDLNWQIYFAILDANGIDISEQKVSFVGQPENWVSCNNPTLAYGGATGGYLVAWNDSRWGDQDIWGTLLDSGGTVTHADFFLYIMGGDQVLPAAAFSRGSGLFEVVLTDTTYPRIVGETVNLAGVGGPSSTLVGGGTSPSIAASGSNFGVVCVAPNGSDEIYFQRTDGSGNPIGSNLRLTNDPAHSESPRIVWTGAEYGVFWSDDRTGGYDTWFQRVTANGTLPDGAPNNVQVTFGGDQQCPDAAFASLGYMATGSAGSGNYNFVAPLGCNYAYQPPCPENLVAYNVTGTAATISWLPAIDNYTDIAYYLVYRNNAQVGQTSSTYFADSGLSLNTTYQYAIRTVNAADYQSTGCGTGSSLYLKTNATLLLTLDKSDPNAVLTWADTSGQTLPNYDVYRGASPQVMHQVANSSTGTYADPGVLEDNVLYFYTVDEPGW